MLQVDANERIPIKMWVSEIEEEALQQAKNLANLPFAFKHIALMPDCHSGYGMPIGGVLATESAIVPNAVGVDIGCGMCSVKTPWTFDEVGVERLKKIVLKIRSKIPVGYRSHGFAQDERNLPKVEDHFFPEIVIRHYEKAKFSVGTLGGGNHFIEIQKDKDNQLWIMIHSGSRNLGKQVADYYNKRAKVFNKATHSAVPQNWDLAFFPCGIDSDYDDYINEMRYCVEFARRNRNLMMERVVESFQEVMKHKSVKEEFLDVPHNYAALENHFGKNVWVHRKGATRARKGELGIIPGSMGTKSYIVEGLGEPMSFMSCSHGAGRILGRRKAKETLNLQDQIDFLDNQGIIHGIEHEGHLDESPAAYKDIDVVMENQKDLVKIVTELYPVASIKG